MRAIKNLILHSVAGVSALNILAFSSSAMTVEKIKTQIAVADDSRICPSIFADDIDSFKLAKMSGNLISAPVLSRQADELDPLFKQILLVQTLSQKSGDTKQLSKDDRALVDALSEENPYVMYTLLKLLNRVISIKDEEIKSQVYHRKSPSDYGETSSWVVNEIFKHFVRVDSQTHQIDLKNFSTFESAYAFLQSHKSVFRSIKKEYDMSLAEIAYVTAFMTKFVSTHGSDKQSRDQSFQKILILADELINEDEIAENLPSLKERTLARSIQVLALPLFAFSNIAGVLNYNFELSQHCPALIATVGYVSVGLFGWIVDEIKYLSFSDTLNPSTVEGRVFYSALDRVPRVIVQGLRKQLFKEQLEIDVKQRYSLYDFFSEIMPIEESGIALSSINGDPKITSRNVFDLNDNMERIKVETIEAERLVSRMEMVVVRNSLAALSESQKSDTTRDRVLNQVDDVLKKLIDQSILLESSLLSNISIYARSLVQGNELTDFARATISNYSKKQLKQLQSQVEKLNQNIHALSTELNNQAKAIEISDGSSLDMLNRERFKILVEQLETLMRKFDGLDKNLESISKTIK